MDGGFIWFKGYWGLIEKKKKNKKKQNKNKMRYQFSPRYVTAEIVVEFDN